MTYQFFLDHQKETQRVLAAAIYDALNAMGEDAKGIYWFCSRHEEYIQGKFDAAA